MSRALLLLAAMAGVLAAAAYVLLDLDDGAHGAAADGSGHRALMEPPGVMRMSVCPKYRENASQSYYWDPLAFPTKLEAELEFCSRVLPASLGGWVVEERFDDDGSYSIAAYVSAATHSVAYDWGGFQPTLWLSCWRAPGEMLAAHAGSETAGPAPVSGSLEAALWYFGPPQYQYGEPTPVEYEFEGERDERQLLWLGHPGQAEVALLLPPDSHRLAADMRRAAAEIGPDDPGPTLTVESWEGESLSQLGASQGSIMFDLLGLERAALPVFDACEVSGGTS